MRLTLICLALAACYSLNGQTPQQSPTDTTAKNSEATMAPVTGEKVFEMFDMEQEPEFPGGQDGLMQFISQHLTYPDSARQNNVEGLVLVSFVIDQEGKVGNTKIIRDIGYGCGEEVHRILMLLPRWKPGIIDGYPVKVRYTLPVRFRLD